MWLVFIYDTYYPGGGIRDLKGTFATEELCQGEIRAAYKDSLCPDDFNAHYCHTDDVRFIQVYDEDTDTFRLESVDPEY